MRFEMNIDYTVTALMFPAIPLIMAVYSNRFHTLSALIRKLHDEHVFEKHIPPEWEKQLKNLSQRINYLKYSIGAAGLGFLFNMMTVLGLYLDKIIIARLNKMIMPQIKVSFDVFLFVASLDFDSENSPIRFREFKKRGLRRGGDI